MLWFQLERRQRQCPYSVSARISPIVSMQGGPSVIGFVREPAAVVAVLPFDQKRRPFGDINRFRTVCPIPSFWIDGAVSRAAARERCRFPWIADAPRLTQ